MQKVQSLVKVGGAEGFYQVKSLVTGVVMSDCTGEERHPLSYLVAAGLDHSVSRTAPLNVHSFMEGVGGVVHDGRQFGWHSLLLHLLQDG